MPKSKRSRPGKFFLFLLLMLLYSYMYVMSITTFSWIENNTTNETIVTAIIITHVLLHMLIYIYFGPPQKIE